MKNVPTWLVPLALAATAAAVAWGDQQNTLNSHDDQIRFQWEAQARIKDALKEQAEINGRIDERTKQIQTQVQQLLQEVRRWNWEAGGNE